MIQDMKKLTFLITNGEYEKFIDDIRQLGVIHVEELQQGATSEELQAGLDLAERYKNALNALNFAAESYESAQAYTALPADASQGIKLIEKIESLLAEENSVKHSIDAAEDAIRQLEPWGEFSWESIQQIGQTGYKPYFYVVNSKLYKAEWGDAYFATPVNEISKKTYFVAFSNEDTEPAITAERLFLPENPLSHYQEKQKSLIRHLEGIRENLLKINAENRASIEAGQLANENNIQLSKVHLCNEDVANGAVKLMIGWTLADNANQVVDYLEKEHIFYEISDPAFEDNVPIKIKNDKFSSLFEPILRMSRHLYDLEKLMVSEYGREALADRTLYDAIVEHRRAYYALKHVNYDLHAPTSINFMIPEQAIESWKADYANMRRFFIYGQSLDFDALMQKMEELQERIRTIATN